MYVESLKEGDIACAYQPDLIVDFPPAPIDKKFEVIRGSCCNVLLEDKNINVLRKLAEQSYHDFLEENGTGAYSIADVLLFVNAFSKKVEGAITPMYKPEIHKTLGYFAEFVDELEDLFYWICYFTRDGPNGGIGLTTMYSIF